MTENPPCPDRSTVLDWIQLYRCPNVGPATFFRLVARFGSAARAVEALPDLARRRSALGYRICPRQAAESEYARALAAGMQVMIAADPRFPPALAGAETAPLFYFKGNAGLFARPALAVVGARDASLAGRKIAARLAGDCGKAGLVIVSGLARGIDTAAHQASLATGTVAVLAGGLDIVYPRENQPLYEAIALQGCLLSEMPPGTEPRAALFPRRNRLVSGLAAGVLVVEAKLRSGSLITARIALDQGREIFAVPGSPLDARAGGTNALIKQGAALTETAADILDVLGAEAPMRRIGPPTIGPGAAAAIDDGELDKALKVITPALTSTPVTVDEIIRQCQLSPAIVSMALIELELSGRLERHPGNQISLIP